MICDEDVVVVGRIGKPHGLCGELSVTFFGDCSDFEEREYLFCRVDGLFVPFFYQSFRFRSETSALIKFEGVDSAAEAHRLMGAEVSVPVEFCACCPGTVSDNYGYVGYTLVDTVEGEVGVIEEIDDQTANILFVVSRPDGSSLLVPAHPDFIESTDVERRRIVMSLPNGLL